MDGSNFKKSKKDSKPPTRPPPILGADGKVVDQRRKTVAVGRAIKTIGPQADPGQRFQYVIGSSEKLLYDYLDCIFDPWNKAGRVPCRVGGFELTTRTWVTRNSGVAYASNIGDAFVAVAAPNWSESGNQDGVPDTRSQLLSVAGNGSAAYSSSPTTVATQFPDLTADIDGGWIAAPMDNPTDTPLMLINDRIRLVAMGLKIRNVSADLAAAGEVMLVGTVNPLGGSQAGSINSQTWDLLLKTNEEVMVKAIKQLPGWAADEEFSIVAIPGEAQCFEMVQPAGGPIPVGNPGAAPGSASRKFPIFNLGCVARGMTPGQKLSYEVTYRWETEVAKTNSTEVLADKGGVVTQDALLEATGNARPYAHAQVPNAHVIPFVQTMASSNPGLVHALGKHPDVHELLRPMKKPLPVRPIVAVEEKGGFLDNILGMGKKLLTAVSKSGGLKAVPFVGPALDTVANLLSSIWA